MPLNPSIFKAYDVRGLYPGELDEATFHDLGRAFVAHLDARRVGVGRDMRLSSPTLAAAFIDGALEQGAAVVDFGLVATDMLYFGVARAGLDGGAQITASHNPAAYNGAKLVGRDALPFSGDAGLSDIRDMMARQAIPPPAPERGALSTAALLDEYVEHVMGFIDPRGIAPFNVVLDAGNGVAGSRRATSSTRTSTKSCPSSIPR